MNTCRMCGYEDDHEWGASCDDCGTYICVNFVGQETYLCARCCVKRFQAGDDDLHLPSMRDESKLSDSARCTLSARRRNLSIKVWGDARKHIDEMIIDGEWPDEPTGHYKNWTLLENVPGWSELKLEIVTLETPKG